MAICRTCLLVTCLLLLQRGGVAVELVPLSQGSPAELTALGNESLGLGQFDSAIRLYQQALDIDKNYFYANYNIGLSYQAKARLLRESGNVKDARPLLVDARRFYQEALRLRPDHSDALSNLGIIAFTLGDYRLAVQRFQLALAQASSDLVAADYAYNLATSHEAIEEWAAAQTAYDSAIKRNPEHFKSHYNLGTLLFRQFQQIRQAESHLLTAHELDPRRPEPLLNLAAIAERTNPSRADQLYTDAIQAANDFFPQMLNTCLWRRARFYFRSDIPGISTKVLMKRDLLVILERDPIFPEANGLLGQYYESIAEYDRAIEHLEQEVTGDRFDRSSEIDLNSHYLLALIYSEHRQNATKALHHATAYYEVQQDEQSEALRRRMAKLLNNNIDATLDTSR